MKIRFRVFTPENLIDFNVLFKVYQMDELTEGVVVINPFCANALFKRHWVGFKERNKDTLRDVEIAEVEKMLSCKSGDRFFWLGARLKIK